MKRYNTFFTILLLTLISISCSKKKEEKKELVRPVKMMQINSLESYLQKGFPAVSQETRNSALSFRVSGPLVKLNIEEGQRVSKGQLIAEIDSRDFRVSLTAKQARFLQTKSEEERYRNLLAKGSVPQNEYDKKQAAFLEAKAEYEAAQNALRDTKLYAPFNAYIDKKFVENFEEVNAKQTIVTLLDLSRIEVKLFIPEILASRFRDFSEYNIIFDIYPDKSFKGIFKEVGKSPDPEGFPLTLYLDHKNTKDSPYKIAPGMSCKVDITLSQREDADAEREVMIPLSALYQKPDESTSSVFVVNRDLMVVEKRKVELGDLASTGKVRVLSGLKQGEWIVTAGASLLLDGQKVKDLQEDL